MYVGPSQSKNETAIFQNLYGSSRYRDFLQGLGSLIKLKEIDPQKNYMGGLSKDGDDGDFASIWQDDVMQVSQLVLIAVIFFVVASKKKCLQIANHFTINQNCLKYLDMRIYISNFKNNNR